MGFLGWDFWDGIFGMAFLGGFLGSFLGGFGIWDFGSMEFWVWICSPRTRTFRKNFPQELLTRTFHSPLVCFPLFRKVFPSSFSQVFSSSFSQVSSPLFHKFSPLVFSSCHFSSCFLLLFSSLAFFSCHFSSFSLLSPIISSFSHLNPPQSTLSFHKFPSTNLH